MKAIERAARRASNSQPGRDGISHFAWFISGRKAHETLFLVALWLAEGLKMPLDFNDSLTVFPPKNSLQGDSEEVIRDPFSLRPISLKNTDNKIIASAVNFSISAAIASKACPIQRGFIPGRRALENVLDLDTKARVYSLQAPPASLPVLAMWDFSTAFASVVHEWIFKCLDSYAFPVGFKNIVDSNYFFCFSYITMESIDRLLAIIRFGVLQGCPLSASLFAVCIDPFFLKIAADLPESSGCCVRACADDLGAFSSIQALQKIFPAFQLAEAVAGLSLKASKCVLVPLHT